MTRILGVEIPVEEMSRILTALDFRVEMTDEGYLRVTVPSHRPDVIRPVDLVEEVARIWGYDRFPTTLMRDELPPQRPNVRLECAERARDLLVGCGLDEVITYSLVDIADEGKLRPQGPPPDPSRYLRLRNPLSTDRAYLRQTLLPSLLRTLRENLRFQERVAIFEIGAVYLPVEGEVLPQEPLRLGIVMAGPREPRSWLPDRQEAPFGFYDLKGVVEALLSGLGLAGTFDRGQHPAFHPGRCAQVFVNGTPLGVMGELHPLVREAFDLPEGLPVWRGGTGSGGPDGPLGCVAERPSSLCTRPSTRDLSLVVDEEMPSVRVQEMILQTGAPLVRSVVLFDVYRGEQVGAGKKEPGLPADLPGRRPDADRCGGRRVREKIIRRLERELGQH